jgi:uncharacterized membrane protein YfcA
MSDLWLPVALTFLAGGLVKGAVGLGLPTVVLGVLGAYMPLAEAAALLVIPSLVTNAWQLFAGPHLRELLRRLGPLVVGMLLGTIFSPVSMATVDTRSATVGLGLMLIIYALFGLFSLRFVVRPPTERWLSPLMGVIAGVVNACTGLFVMPLVPYLQSLEFDKDALVQALALCFTIGSVGLALRLHHDGTAVLGQAAGSAVALLAALAGMPLGRLLRVRASEQTFRTCFFIGLLALGASLAAKAMMR